MAFGVTAFAQEDISEADQAIRIQKIIELDTARLEELKSDAVVEIHPGKSHFTLLSRTMRTRIVKEMVDAFLKN